MVRLIITGCFLVIAFGVLSMLGFLAATAFTVAGHMVSWKLIVLGVLGYMVWKRVK
jgi:hypothetical protein